MYEGSWGSDVIQETASLRQAIFLARPPSVLDPHGPGAARVASLWWLMLVISLVVLAVDLFGRAPKD